MPRSLFFAIVLLLQPFAAVAQRVTGIITDTTGAPVPGVSIRAVHESTTTNALGRFVLRQANGEVQLRHPFFLPRDVLVQVTDGTTVHWTLRPIPHELPIIVVEALPPPSWAAGFEFRRRMGQGHHLTKDAIAKRHPKLTSDLFRTLPGVRVLPGVPTRIRFRGSQCAPLVWLDGAPLGAGEFDVDALSPYSLAAIEVYPSNPPLEFVRSLYNQGACGVIVLWSG